ncbi:MAG: hypothetical protein H0W76_04920 [Pyrinomonadaceae bacterium]|nr:hypothetical protein [Pyrinomonadaceae bacterium]
MTDIFFGKRETRAEVCAAQWRWSITLESCLLSAPAVKRTLLLETRGSHLLPFADPPPKIIVDQGWSYDLEN